MLTKEQCSDALCDLYNQIYGEGYSYEKELDILSDLIEEHFSNPPLTWDDIKEDMWCWDDREKAYIFIFKAWLSDKNVKIIRYYTLDEIVTTQFEDGRFFKTKKEVGGAEE